VDRSDRIVDRGFVVIAAVLLAVGLALTGPARLRLPRRSAIVPALDPERDWVERGRPLWAALALVGGLVLAPRSLGAPVGFAAAAAVWVIVGQSEPAAVRRRSAAVARDLPALVELTAAGLEAGLAVPGALDLAVSALPGAGADALGPIAARMRLGLTDEQVWVTPDVGPVLGPLARALARAQTSGASVAAATRQLADDLAGEARREVEDRARAVGVRAALPLGLCLLPAFVVLGVVPMVAGAVGSISW